MGMDVPCLCWEADLAALSVCRMHVQPIVYTGSGCRRRPRRRWSHSRLLPRLHAEAALQTHRHSSPSAAPAGCAGSAAGHSLCEPPHPWGRLSRLPLTLSHPLPAASLTPSDSPGCAAMAQLALQSCAIVPF